MIGVRLSPEELERLDQWIADNAPGITRPEGIRRMMQLAAKQ